MRAMSSLTSVHEYLALSSGEKLSESLIADRVIRFLYSTARESPSALQRIAASRFVTMALSGWEFDRPLREPHRAIEAMANRLRINLDEVAGKATAMRTYRDLFERQIRYWDVRPMPAPAGRLLSPADGKALAFGFRRDAMLPVKAKWIAIPELVGSTDLASILGATAGVIVRLTPDAYHYVHAPASGLVRSHRLIDGELHSCNPAALVTFTQPYIANLRRVTVIDTDVDGGSNIGLIVVVNVAAMMIGRIEDAYCELRYDVPSTLAPGDFVRAGQPMALFRPGSSTSIVLWSQSRARHVAALARNACRTDVNSRFSQWLLAPWVESAVRVREALAETP